MDIARWREPHLEKVCLTGAVALLMVGISTGCGGDASQPSDTERASIEAGFYTYVDARNASDLTPDILCSDSNDIIGVSTTTAGTTLVVDKVGTITFSGSSDSALIEADTRLLPYGSNDPSLATGNRKWPMAKEDGQWKYCPPVWERGSGSPRP